MNKLEDIIWKLLLGTILGLIIAFGLNLKGSEHKFEVYFYDWQYVFFQSPVFIAACEAGYMETDLSVAVAKSIKKAQDRVAKKKNAVIVVALEDITEIDPLLDVTSEVYDELCRG
jgi:hypothetical protein